MPTPNQEPRKVLDFWVSLSKDLVGIYLHFRADSQRTVREYMVKEYYDQKTGLWKLPWCTIYETEPREGISIDAKCGPLTKEMFG